MQVKQKKWQHKVLRFLLRWFFGWRYRIHVSGAEYIPVTGGVLLLGNHQSYLDWALLQLVCPRPIHFVLSRSIYQKWHLAKLFKWLNLDDYVIPISSHASKEAILAIRARLMAGEVVLVFPEGRVSRNGQMDSWQRGFEIVIKDTSASMVPFYFVGLWGSLGSFASPISHQLQSLQGRHITICFGAKLPATTQAQQVRQIVSRLSIQAWEQFLPCQRTLAAVWLLAAKKLRRKIAVADSTGIALSSMRVLVAVRFFQRQLRQQLAAQNTVGLLLPLSVGGVIVNLAMFALGKVVINLNYTAGSDALNHAVKSSGIGTIITSRQFKQRLDERGFALGHILSATTVIYIEDVRKSGNKWKFLLDLLYCRLVPHALLAKQMLPTFAAQNTAAILFSSGSEGKPKGVELSHQNIVSNVLQIIQVVNLQHQDVLLSTLPLFHAYGLTVNMLTPLFAGIPFVCQADPTDAIAVGRLTYQYRATILTGTASFLNIYCRQRKLDPILLQSLRLVIAGAEKVSPRIRQAFKLRFGLTIYEGYGTTETAPVASISLPDVVDQETWRIIHTHKEGSVGLPLPGTVLRIVDPDTLQDLPTNEAGLILIGGPQVKRGYWQEPERTSAVIVSIQGVRWYKTGDKGYIDEDGFLYIVDRYSRFAKIGGEMISLTAVEEAVLRVLADDEAQVCAVAIPDDKKGERIILFYCAVLTELELHHLLLQSSIENIMLPAKLIKLSSLPKLGSGKNDYQQAKKIALELGDTQTNAV